MKNLEEESGLNKSAVRNLIKVMEDIGILKEITGHKRNRIYIFDEYLKLFTG